MRLVLLPLGKIETDFINELGEILGRSFGCPVEIAPAANLPEQAYKKGRGQYSGTAILNDLKPREKLHNGRILGIIDADIYSTERQFVFGHADPDLNVAVISLYRLRPELPPDRALFLNRAAKEAIHELGHTFGLDHCPANRCVMHFSHSISDTDMKSQNFCSKCQPKLIQ